MQSPRNVLLIVVDQWRGLMLPRLGADYLKLPNLDRLCAEGVTFRTPREVIRFLYLHEWMHWYLKERLGRKARAETTCDRFALRCYKRGRVTEEDADAALRPER